MTISFLRLTALIVGISIILYTTIRHRRYSADRSVTVLVALAGITLTAFGAWPGLANLPADLFALRDEPGGRLISLLVIAVVVLWFAMVWNRAKFARLDLQHDRLVRALAIERARSVADIAPGGIWIALPALNEAENLRTLLPSMPTHVGDRPVHALVIDDGSSDGTDRAAVELGAAVMHMPINSGGGLALRAAFDLALERDANCVVTMDADGQHDPAELEILLEPIVSGEADIVVGSRVLGTHEPASRSRSIGVRVFNAVISRLLGRRITDCASGYRAITADALKQLHLTQAQYHTAELIIDAAKRGLRIREVPITIRRRRSGVSKKGPDLAYGLMFLRTIIKTWLR